MTGIVNWSDVVSDMITSKQTSKLVTWMVTKLNDVEREVGMPSHTCDIDEM